MNGRPMTRAVSLLVPEPWDNNDALSPERRAYDAYQSMLMNLGTAPPLLPSRTAAPWAPRWTATACVPRATTSPATTASCSPPRWAPSRSTPPTCLPADVWGRARCSRSTCRRAVCATTTSCATRWQSSSRSAIGLTRRPSPWTPLCKSGATAIPSRLPAQRMRAFPARCAPPSWAYTGMTWTKSCVPWRPPVKHRLPPWASTRPSPASGKTRSFFDYFYQLFAQVTNPPIDALREAHVTSTVLYLGNHGNLLEDCRNTCQGSSAWMRRC